MKSQFAGWDEPIDAYSPSNSESLPLTGERTAPGIWHENYWFRRHEAAYEFLLDVVRDRLVLEIGCGEGYGTALLGHGARRVIGLDYDSATVAHAASRYPATSFVRANLAALPVRSASFDVVASLQVIEHVWDHAQFVGECLRVLRPGSALLITTPNRLTFSPGRDAPRNPFHTHEFTADELVATLTSCGAEAVRVFGLHAGARLLALDRKYGGSFADAQIDTSPQEWNDELAGDVAGVRTADFAVTGERIDSCLDLVVVARGAS